MKTTLLKSVFVLGLTLGLMSCNDRNENGVIQEISPVAIDSVKIVNDTMTVFDVQSITTYSKFHKGCEGFYGYDYDKDQMNRYVTAYKFKTNETCGDQVTGWAQFNFRPESTGTYVFKFLKGQDASGNDIWLEKNIVVKN